MRPFSYASATTLDEVTGALAHAGADGARPLAGGTDLLTLMKGEIVAPARLIDIKRVRDLSRAIEETPAGVRIGALATLAQIEESALLGERYPALVAAASLAATPQLRNMATLGGNLLQRPRCWYYRSEQFHCWLKGGEQCFARGGENQLHAVYDVSPCVAVHPSDPAVALLAYDADVALRGTGGERRVPLADVLAPPTAERRSEAVLAPDELIVAVQLPPAIAGTRAAWRKAMDRKAWAFALVSVAVVVRMDGARIDDARIALGGVAPVPWQADDAERLLRGETASPELLEQAADAVVRDMQPLAHNAYKLPLARALVAEALREAVG